jgi:methylated-DNA-[protein]-cysteine S-methyltransferase
MSAVLTIEAVATPIGTMLLAADADGIMRAADFADCATRFRGELARRYPAGVRNGSVPAAMAASLAAYFAGDLAALLRIDVRPQGTAFQRQVWEALRAIAPGRPLTYGALARELGRPRAMRAVGHANGANPVCVVVPCHRLVGHDGALTGYSGGMQRKRWLLDHEARNVRAA